MKNFPGVLFNTQFTASLCIKKSKNLIFYEVRISLQDWCRTFYVWFLL